MSSWKRTLTSSLLLLLVVVAGCPTVEEMAKPDAPLELKTGDQPKVINIVKGDELEVEKDGKKAKVRLLGLFGFTDVMDDPELAKLREISVTWMLKNVLNQPVKITLGDPAKDPHGRTLAYAELGGNDLGAALLSEGAVVVYTEFPIEKEDDYLKVEAAARSAKKGLWASEKATKLVTALRKQWSEIRAKGKKPLTGDALVEVGAAGGSSASAEPE